MVATGHTIVAAWLCGAVLSSYAAVAATGTELILNLPENHPSNRVMVLVFDSASAFGDLRDPVRVLTTVPKERRFRIADLPAGRYACAVYIDRNDNGVIDRNFIGIPTEPLGFSNNYRPRGPPNFSLASFRLQSGTTVQHDIILARPLGPRGRIGVGAGVIARSNPYRQADSQVLQWIPALVYVGERVQILGPSVRLGLWGSGRLRTALQASYRAGVYEEDDSPILAGLDDRRNTVMAGPAFGAELPAGVDVSFRYQHDVLDRIGGGSARLAVDRSLQWRRATFTPTAAVVWTQSDLAAHDFGVSARRATADRAAYRPGDIYSVETGLGVFVEVTRGIRAFANVAVEVLDSDVTDSPIVDKSYVVKGVATVTYAF